MKVALIHDWLTGMRGGEKCLEIFCELYPEADIFTLLHLKGSISPVIERHAIHTSFVQNLPFVARRYRHYLPFFPTAIEQFDLREYDLILSSSHCVAKGGLAHPGSVHVCYCHTPMRYVWSMYHEYFGPDRVKGLQRKIIEFSANYLRQWDVASSNRVDYFIANSNHVRKRIEKYYRREADVIYPPVDVADVSPASSSEDFYLIVSALVPYKKVELAVQVFTQLNKKLVIIGKGGEEARLRKIAGPTIEFLGWKDGTALADYYANCRALIFPGEEDFGIVPVEAQAYGKPVIAFAKGGALETVKGISPDESGKYDSLLNKTDEFTGIFFNEQTVKSLAAAVDFVEKINFDPNKIHEQALQFDREVFQEKIKQRVEKALIEG